MYLKIAESEREKGTKKWLRGAAVGIELRSLHRPRTLKLRSICSTENVRKLLGRQKEDISQADH